MFCILNDIFLTGNEIFEQNEFEYKLAPTSWTDIGQIGEQKNKQKVSMIEDQNKVRTPVFNITKFIAIQYISAV